MSKFTQKRPEDFPTYQKWIDLPGDGHFRQKMQKADSDLQDAQKKYSSLKSEIDKQYTNPGADLDRLESIEAQFEDCKKEIKKLQKQRKKIKEEQVENDSKRNEAWQEFLLEVAESGYLESLADEYKQAMQTASDLSQAIRFWSGNKTIRGDLQTITPFEMYFKPERIDQATDAMVNRLNDLKNNNNLKKVSK